MKKIIFFAAALLFLTSCQESLEKRAERMLQDYSEKNCPMRLSEFVTMDSCRFEKSTHTLHYFYQLTGTLDNDSTLNTGTMRELLVTGLRNETSTRVYKEAGYNFMYTYFSQKHPENILFETIITKEEYE